MCSLFIELEEYIYCIRHANMHAYRCMRDEPEKKKKKKKVMQQYRLRAVIANRGTRVLLRRTRVRDFGFRRALGLIGMFCRD